MKKIINLDKNFSILLERTHFEYFTMKENVIFLIEQHKDDADFFDTALFQKYHDKQVAKKLEYETIKQEMINTYIPEDLRKDPKMKWTVDFENKLLIIEGV